MFIKYFWRDIRKKTKQLAWGKEKYVTKATSDSSQRCENQYKKKRHKVSIS